VLICRMLHGRRRRHPRLDIRVRGDRVLPRYGNACIGSTGKGTEVKGSRAGSQGLIFADVEFPSGYLEPVAASYGLGCGEVAPVQEVPAR
jgi:hypothetical protein